MRKNPACWSRRSCMIWKSAASRGRLNWRAASA